MLRLSKQVGFFLGVIIVVKETGDVTCLKEREVTAFEINNAGNVDVRINKKRTLKAGQAVSYGIGDLGKFIGDLNIEFSDSGDNPRIEITPLITKSCE